MTARFLIPALALLACAPLATSSCSYSQVLHRQESGLAKLRSSLAQAQDRASADAAALAVDRYGSLLHEDLRTLVSNGRPSLIQLALLKNSYMDSAISAEAKGALAEFFRLYGQGFYGSSALRQAFLNVIRGCRTAF